METKNKNKKKENKRSSYRGVLKTGILHKELCVQSLSADKFGRNKRKEQNSSPHGRMMRMCVLEHYLLLD